MVNTQKISGISKYTRVIVKERNEEFKEAIFDLFRDPEPWEHSWEYGLSLGEIIQGLKGKTLTVYYNRKIVEDFLQKCLADGILVMTENEFWWNHNRSLCHFADNEGNCSCCGAPMDKTAGRRDHCLNCPVHLG